MHETPGEASLQIILKSGICKHRVLLGCQVVDLRKSIEEDQRLLVQWAEEKMSLACIMSDLLDMHVIQLDKDLQGLESELEVRTNSMNSIPSCHCLHHLLT